MNMRTTEEIQKRIDDVLLRPTAVLELDDRRQAEVEVLKEYASEASEVSETSEAKVDRLMRCWRRAIENGDEGESQEYLAKMRSYKWLLGHVDADTFVGSVNSKSSAGPWARDSFAIIRHQIETGEFDLITESAKELHQTLQAKRTEASRAALPAATQGIWRTEYVTGIEGEVGGECRVIVRVSGGEGEGEGEAKFCYDLFYKGRFVGSFDTLQEAFSTVDANVGEKAARGSVLAVAEEVAVGLYE